MRLSVLVGSCTKVGQKPTMTGVARVRPHPKLEHSKRRISRLTNSSLQARGCGAAGKACSAASHRGTGLNPSCSLLMCLGQHKGWPCTHVGN